MSPYLCKRRERSGKKGRASFHPLCSAEKAPDAAPWAVFDANLAKQVLEDHKLPAGHERFITEDARLPVESIVEEVLRLHPTGWTLTQLTTKTILRLAGLGHAIIVGRGGNIITARLPNVFHVRLVAPLATRIRHTAEYYQLTPSDQFSKGERSGTTPLREALLQRRN